MLLNKFLFINQMENTEKTIPVYEFIFNADDVIEGLYNISLVNEPAILEQFLMFNKSKPIEKFKTVDQEKRIITGPVMIPGMRIYREDAALGAYYGYFSEETIYNLVQKYFKDNKINSFNINHNQSEKIYGAYVIESWFTAENDKAASLGYNLPRGTW